MIVILLSAIALAAAVAAPRWMKPETAARFGSWEAPLRRRGALVAGLVSVAVVWFTWDALVPVAKVHDESSYLLQSDIFASLRWTAPSPPLPEFFEQPHVQVVPKLASKYPPGHALLLSLGAAVGFHALVPLLLTGITGALVFALAMRVTDPWTGVLTWLAWITAPIVLRFQPGYFSEVTTTALVLASWWLLLDWRETRRRSPLLLLALAIGWGAITRQLTMLAFAIPIGVVVVRDTVRLKAWRDFALAFAIGVAVLSILPLWSWRTTGDWRLSPQAKWTQDYVPFDRIGFALDSTPPRRELSKPLDALYRSFSVLRASEELKELPLNAADRVLHLAIAYFQKARLPLAFFALIGLIIATRDPRLRFGVVSCATLFVAYLSYYYGSWMIYYLETAPVVSALIAIGVAWTARQASDAGGTPAAIALASGAIAVFGVQGVRDWRVDHRILADFNRAFALKLRELPSHPAIVFVRYSPRPAQHISVVRNHADLAAAPVWVVHDRGAQNAELLKLAPGRRWFDFDEDQALVPVTPGEAPRQP
jgi:hypothetical protein